MLRIFAFLHVAMANPLASYLTSEQSPDYLELCTDDKLVKDATDIPDSSCLGGICSAYRNAACNGTTGKCQCSDKQCLMNGECVERNDCTKSTGVTCNAFGCAASINAVCFATPGRVSGHMCVCAADECAVGGKCIKKPPATKGYPQICTGSAVLKKATEIPLSSCLFGNCSAYRNAHCNEDSGVCQCEANQCNLNGECVKTKECAKWTGGQCDFMPCSPSRNAVCLATPGRHFSGSECVCGADECAVEGACVKKPKKKVECAKWTGGQCNVLPCGTSRNSICQATPGLRFTGHLCVCAADQCAVGGQCVAKSTIEDFPSDYAASDGNHINPIFIAVTSAVLMGAVSIGLVKRSGSKQGDYIPLAA